MILRYRIVAIEEVITKLSFFDGRGILDGYRVRLSPLWPRPGQSEVNPDGDLTLIFREPPLIGTIVELKGQMFKDETDNS